NALRRPSALLYRLGYHAASSAHCGTRLRSDRASRRASRCGSAAGCPDCTGSGFDCYCWRVAVAHCDHLIAARSRRASLTLLDGSISSIALDQDFLSNTDSKHETADTSPSSATAAT